MKTSSSLEPLEPRIAPASVTIAGKTATWLDWDGDIVSLKWTGAVAPDLSHFHVPDAVNHPLNLIMDQIILGNANDAVTVNVKRGATGDGRVDLGHIAAPNVPLKSFVAPKASVLEFDCGDGTHAIGTLTLGSYGTVEPLYFTAPGADGFGGLIGAVGKTSIAGDVAYGIIQFGASAATPVGSVTIGGSLLGNVAAATSDTAGDLTFMGPVASVKIGRNIVGGAPDHTGRIFFGASFGSVVVGGSVLGGGGSSSGSIESNATSLAGTKLSVGGSIVGGAGLGSGVVSIEEPIKAIAIGGSVIGGTNNFTGAVQVTKPTGSITVGGSVIGSSGSGPYADCGVIEAGGDGTDVGSIHIVHDLVAIAGPANTASKNWYDGAIMVRGSLGSLTIGGSVLGSSSDRALILVHGTMPTKPGNFNAIGKIAIGGSMEFAVIVSGNSGSADGYVAGQDNLNLNLNPDAGIGSLTIGGDFLHSSVMAGTTDKDKIGVGRIVGAGTADTQSKGDPGRTAILGPVTIKGAILDDAGASGDSGFEAEQIAKITAGGATLFKHGDPMKFFDSTQFVFAVEIPAV